MWWKPRRTQHYKDEKDLTVFIYGLIDPITDKIFYVGKTRNPLGQRLNSHIHNARTGDTARRSEHIRAILLAGCKPTISLIETTNMEHYQEIEKSWIARLKECGYELDNSDSGGGGML